ncbi:MAG TPA: ATP-binding protein [Polyangiales bacterium]
MNRDSGLDQASNDTRKNETDALQRHEVYRQILDAIADMVLVKGKDSRILWANKAFRDYYGMSNEQLRDIVDAPFNRVDYTQQYVLDDFKVYSTGETLAIAEEPVTRCDGVVQLFSTMKSAIRDEEGVVRMTVGVSRNITETKRMQQDAQRYREQLERDRLAGFAAQLPGFLFQYRVRSDGSEHVPFISARVREYYGVHPDELASSADLLFQHVQADDVPSLRGAFRTAALELTSVQSVHRVQGADHKVRWVEMIAQPSRQPDGSVLFNGYVHDISERRAVELERERLISELRERNAEMEQFAYAISHDLKSPLVTIRGYLGAIEEDVQQGRQTRALADLQRIRTAAEKMSRMLADLLELSRVGRVDHDPSDVSLAEVLREACELLAGQIRAKNVEVSIDVGATHLFVDRRRALQVFQNIIDNAVKCMASQPTPRIVITCRDEEDFVVVSVRDNGMGLSSSHFTRIFGLFEKLDPKADGTGIGLALVRSIVDAHGGRVWVESEGPGHGAVFHVRLPACRKAVRTDKRGALGAQ